MEKYSVVGKPLPRVDAGVKVMGQAQFAGDVKLPNMLYGKILRSPYPHAKIIKINTSKAEALPGVKVVITSKDTAPVKYGFVDTPRYPCDQDPLAVDKVRYIGEEVAAVAAVDDITAAEAVKLIEVEYEQIPAVFDPEEALKEGAPKVHEQIVPNRKCAWEDWGIARGVKTFKVVNNVCATSDVSFGDIEKGFAESDYVREARFVIPATQHATMEPHVALASYESGTGKLNVWLTHMSAALKRYWLARTLGIQEAKVRVRRCYTGGTFGGKIDLFSYEFLAAFLSKKTDRPVRIVLSREETFIACRVSHRMIIDLKIGVKKDGTIMARDTKLINDPGAYRGSSPVAMYLSHIYRDVLYNIPHWKHKGVGVYTNKSVCMSKRGHGSPQTSFANESLLEMLADDIGMDSAELRLKNVRHTGDVLPNGDRLDSCGLAVGIEGAIKATNWKEKRGKGRDKYQGIGMGLSGMFSGAMYYPFASSAIVKINADSTATLFTGASEFGQGSDTVMSQIAAEELGLSLDNIILVSGDSEMTPPDLGGFLSGGVYVSGEAVRRAAADAKNQLLVAAAEILKVTLGELQIKNGFIYVKTKPERRLSFAETARTNVQSHDGDSIIGKGFVKPVPEVEFYPSLSKGQGRLTDAYGLTVVVAEVKVDPGIGKVSVTRVTVADDCGQHINPKNVYGQLLGQVSMAVGDVLFEQVVTEEGRVINPTFEDYKIAGIYEMPEFVHVPTGTIEPKGPFGAKEVGECSRSAVMAAIANAIADAVGVRFHSLPITPEKILKAIRNRNKED